LTSSYSHSRHQDHHHRPGVVLNPHPPLAYAPEIVAGLTPEHQVPHLGGAYGARNWAFGEYAQAFQLAVSALVLYSMITSWLKVLPKRGEGNRSWLSSALGIRSELKPGGHKSHDWLHIGGQIILKGKFNFLTVLFYGANPLPRFSGQIEGGVIVYLCASIPSCSCCETCRVSERSVHAVFGYA